MCLNLMNQSTQYDLIEISEGYSIHNDFLDHIIMKVKIICFDGKRNCGQQRMSLIIGKKSSHNQH